MVMPRTDVIAAGKLLKCRREAWLRPVPPKSCIPMIAKINLPAEG